MTDRRARWPVTPLPGVTRKQLLDKLAQVLSEAINARSPGVGVTAQQAYLRWTNTAVEHLNTVIGPNDLERLVLTRRYWTIQEAPVFFPIAAFENWTAMNNLVNVELGERVRLLSDTVQELQEVVERWSRNGRFVLADTSFYMHHIQKFDEADYHDLIDDPLEPIHLLIPILVIDELDRLKRSGQGSVRGRAQQTLAILDSRFKDPARSATLQLEAFTPVDGEGGGGIDRGEVTIEILFDPLGHARLPIADDEIIDRAVSAQVLADREVTFLTCDTNQSMRARLAGLRAVKLPPESGHSSL